MHEILNRNLFFVKEHVGFFKAASNFDIYAPETGQEIMQCREEQLGVITKILRFTDYKRMTPFDVQIRMPDGRPVLRVTRGVTLFLSKVTVYDELERPIGGFKQKFFSIGGAFDVLDINENVVCTLKGKWTGWEFSFMNGDARLAHVSKKWAGIGKELFTTADNYILEIDGRVPQNEIVRALIVAAVMCIDLVLKE
jgi:uncharacterized protein YxjI